MFTFFTSWHWTGWRRDRTSVFDWRTFPDLRLIYGWHVTSLWVRCGYGSTKQANSAFHPIGVSKWVVIHVITWFTGVETIKRQTMSCACGCLAGRLQARVCGLSLQAYRLYFSSVCDVQRCSSCSCRLWCYISVMPLPVLLLLSGYPLYVKTF